MKPLLLGLIGLYQRWLSPALHAFSPGQGCKFRPTCSEYAAEAITLYGAWKGGRMAAWRLLRCNPFGRGGFDPVPLPESSWNPDADGPRNRPPDPLP